MRAGNENDGYSIWRGPTGDGRPKKADLHPPPPTRDFTLPRHCAGYSSHRREPSMAITAQVPVPLMPRDGLVRAQSGPRGKNAEGGRCCHFWTHASCRCAIPMCVPINAMPLWPGREPAIFVCQRSCLRPASMQACQPAFFHLTVRM